MQRRRHFCDAKRTADRPDHRDGFRARCCNRRGAPLRRFAGRTRRGRLQWPHRGRGHWGQIRRPRPRTRAAALRPAFLPARISGSGARRCVTPFVRSGQSRRLGLLPPTLLLLPRSDSAAAHGRAQDRVVPDVLSCTVRAAEAVACQTGAAAEDAYAAPLAAASDWGLCIVTPAFSSSKSAAVSIGRKCEKSPASAVTSAAITICCSLTTACALYPWM